MPFSGPQDERSISLTTALPTELIYHIGTFCFPRDLKNFRRASQAIDAAVRDILFEDMRLNLDASFHELKQFDKEREARTAKSKDNSQAAISATTGEGTDSKPRTLLSRLQRARKLTLGLNTDGQILNPYVAVGTPTRGISERDQVLNVIRPLMPEAGTYDTKVLAISEDLYSQLHLFQPSAAFSGLEFPNLSHMMVHYSLYLTSSYVPPFLLDLMKTSGQLSWIDECFVDFNGRQFEIGDRYIKRRISEPNTDLIPMVGFQLQKEHVSTRGGGSVLYRGICYAWEALNSKRPSSVSGDSGSLKAFAFHNVPERFLRMSTDGDLIAPPGFCISSSSKKQTTQAGRLEEGSITLSLEALDMPPRVEDTSPDASSRSSQTASAPFICIRGDTEVTDAQRFNYHHEWEQAEWMAVDKVKQGTPFAAYRGDWWTDFPAWSS